MGRERGRKTHDGFYDMRVHDIDALGEDACSLQLEIVVRSLCGFSSDIPVKPTSNDICVPVAADDNSSQEISPRSMDKSMAKSFGECPASSMAWLGEATHPSEEATNNLVDNDV